MKRRGLTWIAVAVVAALAVVYRAPIARALVAGALDLLTGTRVSFAAMHLGRSESWLTGVVVRRGPDPLLTAGRIAARYDLRDLLPGGTRRYGLIAVSLERPHLWIVRHVDGSSNIALGGAGGSGGAPGTPLDVGVTVRDGAVTLLDPGRVHPDARRFDLTAIRVDAALDSAHRSRATGSAALATVAGSIPVDLAYHADAAIGRARADVRAAGVPLGPIVDYFANTASVTALGGEARSVDLRAFGLGPPGEVPPLRLGGSADVRDGGLLVPGVAVPITGLSGRLDLFDDGLTTQRLSGAVAGVGIRARGAIFGFANPSFRLAVRGSGDFSRLRDVVAVLHGQPLAGSTDVDVVLEGPVGDPLVSVALAAPRLNYGNYPLDRATARVVYYESAVDVVPVRASYGPLALRADGSFKLGDTLRTRVAVTANGPARAVPYADQLVPAATLHAVGLLLGDGAAWSTRGIVSGAGGGDRLDGAFSIDPRGRGWIGPLDARRADGSRLVAAFEEDRSQNRSAVWAGTRGYTLAAATAPALPGLPQFPGIPLSGRIEGDAVGAGTPATFAFAGRIVGGGLHAGGVALGSARTGFAGTLSDLRLAGTRVAAPWGRFDGGGTYDGEHLFLSGEYAGSFDALATLTGNLGAHGPVAGPVRLSLSSGGVTVQTPGARTPGSRIQGVPLAGVAGTFGVAGSNVRIYAGLGRVGGGDLAAAGSLSGGVDVAAARVAAGALAGAGLPLAGGSVATLGRFSSRGPLLDYRGGVVLRHGRTNGVPLSGSGIIHLHGSALDVAMASGRAAGAVGDVSGSVGDVGRGAPTYDLRLGAVGIALAPLAAAAGLHGLPVTGAGDGQFRIGGTGADPRAAGVLSVPIATLNGLAIEDARVPLEAAPARLRVAGATAAVGSTTLDLSAAGAADGASIAIGSGAADLADFNDFFDPGEALAGRGRIDLRAGISGPHPSGALAADLAGVRVGALALGTVRADVAGTGRDVRGSVATDGPLGTASVAGTVGFPVSMNAPGTTRLDLRIKTAGLDLRRLAVAAGRTLPLDGNLAVDGHIGGTIGKPFASGDVALTNAHAGRLPIDRAQASLDASPDVLTLHQGVVSLSGLTITGNGTVGLGTSAPLALQFHATAPDIGPLVAGLRGSSLPVGGSLESSVLVKGTLRAPQVLGGFDVEGAHASGLAVPRMIGEFAASGRSVELRNTEIDIGSGTIDLAGAIPFTVAPFGLGPAGAPLGLDLAVKGVDLGEFASFLPAGSELHGALGGRIGLGGTVADPEVTGGLELARGSIVTPFETTALTDVAAKLTLAQKQARIEEFTAHAGSGTISGSARIDLANLLLPAASDPYEVIASASNAALDVPAFGRGQLNADLILSHAAGARPMLSGSARVDRAIIPFAAIGGAAGTSSLSGTGPAIPDLGLGLDLVAGNDVRVRSGSIDIGATGSARATGTLANPTLSGRFTSTGGTLTYFSTVFRVIDGSVAFEPDLGAIPVLDAHAVTTVLDSTAATTASGRSGGPSSATVDLTLTGPVTNLTVGLTSDPPYTRDQILALLVSTPAVNSLVAGLSGGSSSGGIQQTVSAELFGLANAQFTRNLLGPAETVLGKALGLSNLDVSVGFGGNVGVTARKVLGKTVNAIASTSFAYPYRQSVGLELKAARDTVAQLTFYQTYAVNSLGSSEPLVLRDPTLLESATGTYGYSFNLQRRF